MAGRYSRIKDCMKDLLKNREGRKASSLSSQFCSLRSLHYHFRLTIPVMPLVTISCQGRRFSLSPSPAIPLPSTLPAHLCTLKALRNNFREREYINKWGCPLWQCLGRKGTWWAANEPWGTDMNPWHGCWLNTILNGMKNQQKSLSLICLLYCLLCQSLRRWQSLTTQNWIRKLSAASANALWHTVVKLLQILSEVSEWTLLQTKEAQKNSLSLERETSLLAH